MQNDYDRIATAIEFLEKNVSRQPPLADVAAHVGLSESQLQRVFTRWAGISPKRFLQHLTADRAQQLLYDGRPVLAAAYEAGLSAPSRLYDLMINATAITPGEHRERGAGLFIRHAVHESPFGPAFIAVTDRGICQLGFIVEGSDKTELETLKRRWPNARIEESMDATRPFIDRIFNGMSDETPIPVHLKGTNFQLQVWNALLRIPSGAVTTYDTIARDIGSPTAHRAVGSAIGRNPVALLIPCHRVIRKSGDVGDYHWGSTRKRAILAWEAAHREIA
jgi:AraC family transcriptional regulator of adaptative response/methylated-DNA-[protein]-cysteine methyltransferase